MNLKKIHVKYILKDSLLKYFVRFLLKYSEILSKTMTFVLLFGKIIPQRANKMENIIFVI